MLLFKKKFFFKPVMLLAGTAKGIALGPPSSNVLDTEESAAPPALKQTRRQP